MAQVGIVILNYNNVVDLKQCVDSVLAYTPRGMAKIVVVDNGSEKKCREEIHQYLLKKNSTYLRINENEVCDRLSDITYLCIRDNLGYACGNNKGIDFLCNFDTITHIMILNSDIIFTEDIITPLLEYMNCLPDAGAISPLLYKPNGKVDHCCARYNYPIYTMILTFSFLFSKKYIKLNEKLKILLQNPSMFNQQYVEIELPSGSCMLFNKEVIKKIGGFDPNTFLYYEESILYKKIKLEGKQNYLVPSISCIHTGGKTTTSQKTAYFLKKCNYESLLYYLRTYENCPMLGLFYVQVTGLLRLFRLGSSLLLKKMLFHRC